MTITLLRRSVHSTDASANIAQVSLDFVPSSALHVSLSTFDGVRGLISLGSPQNVTFASVPLALSQYFQFNGAPVGDYNITTVVAGPSASEYGSPVFPTGRIIHVMAPGEYLPPPVLLFARFSDDGSTVVAHFDNPVAWKSSSSFQCDAVLQFEGASSAQCAWSNDWTELSILLNSALGLNSGDVVTLKNGILEALCIPEPLSARRARNGRIQHQRQCLCCLRSTPLFLL